MGGDGDEAGSQDDSVGGFGHPREDEERAGRRLWVNIYYTSLLPSEEVSHAHAKTPGSSKEKSFRGRFACRFEGSGSVGAGAVGAGAGIEQALGRMLGRILGIMQGRARHFAVR